MEWFSPEFFDTLVIATMIIGLSLAAVRFYRDMSRPPAAWPDGEDEAGTADESADQDDTRPGRSAAEPSE